VKITAVPAVWGLGRFGVRLTPLATVEVIVKLTEVSASKPVGDAVPVAFLAWAVMVYVPPGTADVFQIHLLVELNGCTRVLVPVGSLSQNWYSN